MFLRANAKLGLAGRVALVRAIEGGLSLRAAAAAFCVSPATAHRWWHRWLEAGEDVRRSLASCSIARASPPLAAPARTGVRGGDLRLSPQHRLGTEIDRRRDRLRALHRLEGAPPGRDLPTAASGQGAGQPLRVALPGRSAAHGRLPLRAFSATRPQGDGQPLALARLDAPRDQGRPRLRACDRRTTPGSPTSSSTTTRKQRPSPASSNARSPSTASTASSRNG
jgi:Homeodomain-like domain